MITRKKISGGKWTAHPNSSWDEEYKKNHGDRLGYVICYGKGASCLATVIGQPFVPKEEIEANAKVIALAPEMLRLLEKLIDLTFDGFDPVIAFDAVDKLQQEAKSLLTEQTN